MINKYKYKAIAIVIYFLLLSGCQSVQDSLEGKQKNNSDEFLIEKKNPLVLPPEFNSLPEPEFSKADETNEEELSIKKTKKSSTKESFSTIEKSILDKIK